MRRKEEWARFALYPRKGWFGWWNVRCVIMDKNAYFVGCVNVAKFRSEAAARDFCQAIEMSECYDLLFDEGIRVSKEPWGEAGWGDEKPTPEPHFIPVDKVEGGSELREIEDSRESKAKEA